MYSVPSQLYSNLQSGFLVERPHQVLLTSSNWLIFSPLVIGKATLLSLNYFLNDDKQQTHFRERKHRGFWAIDIRDLQIQERERVRLRVFTARRLVPRDGVAVVASEHNFRLWAPSVPKKSLFFFSAHSPDNSFLGFAVPQREGNNAIKTRKAALVYGKDPDFWKVRKKIKPEWKNKWSTNNEIVIELQSSYLQITPLAKL